MQKGYCQETQQTFPQTPLRLIVRNRKLLPIDRRAKDCWRMPPWPSHAMIAQEDSRSLYRQKTRETIQRSCRADLNSTAGILVVNVAAMVMPTRGDASDGDVGTQDCARAMALEAGESVAPAARSGPLPVVCSNVPQSRGGTF